MTTAQRADATRAAAAARVSGRGFIQQGRDEHGRPRKPLVVHCNPPRYAWLRCERRCGWRLKALIGRAFDSVDELGRCPDCKAGGKVLRHRDPRNPRTIIRRPVGVIVERLVSR